MGIRNGLGCVEEGGGGFLVTSSGLAEVDILDRGILGL